MTDEREHDKAFWRDDDSSFTEDDRDHQVRDAPEGVESVVRDEDVLYIPSGPLTPVLLIVASFVLAIVLASIVHHFMLLP